MLLEPRCRLIPNVGRSLCQNLFTRCDEVQGTRLAIAATQAWVWLGRLGGRLSARNVLSATGNVSVSATHVLAGCTPSSAAPHRWKTSSSTHNDMH